MSTLSTLLRSKSQIAISAKRVVTAESTRSCLSIVGQDITAQRAHRTQLHAQKRLISTQREQDISLTVRNVCLDTYAQQRRWARSTYQTLQSSARMVTTALSALLKQFLVRMELTFSPRTWERVSLLANPARNTTIARREHQTRTLIRAQQEQFVRREAAHLLSARPEHTVPRAQILGLGLTSSRRVTAMLDFTGA